MPVLSIPLDILVSQVMSPMSNTTWAHMYNFNNTFHNIQSKNGSRLQKMKRWALIRMPDLTSTAQIVGALLLLFLSC